MVYLRNICINTLHKGDNDNDDDDDDDDDNNNNNNNNNYSPYGLFRLLLQLLTTLFPARFEVLTAVFVSILVFGM